MNESAAPTPTDASEVEAKPATLELRARTWWILGISVVLILATVILIDQSASWGDNGFPTTSEDLDSRWLVRAGERDLVPTLDDAPLLSVAEAHELKLGRKALLLPTDRVVGVVHSGLAVCVLARALNWHEVAHVQLGDATVALTFSPLCDAPRAFVLDDMQLAHSGLLYCSNPLLYDRGETPSLWSQLDGRARSGPRKGEVLEQIPVELAQWADWIARYPETRFLRPQLEERGKVYRMNSYGPYLRSDVVRFPAPPAEGLGAKERVLVVEQGGERRVYSQAQVLEQLGERGELEPGVLHERRWTTEQGGQPLTFVVHLDASEADPHSVRVEPPARLVSEGLWFALKAFDPELRPAQ